MAKKEAVEWQEKVGELKGRIESKRRNSLCQDIYNLLTDILADFEELSIPGKAKGLTMDKPLDNLEGSTEPRGIKASNGQDQPDSQGEKKEFECKNPRCGSEKGHKHFLEKPDSQEKNKEGLIVIIKRGKPYDYVRTEEVFCCKEMEEAWKERAVNFGEFDTPLSKDKGGVSIYRCFPYPEGACWDEYEINFCPFCGKKIIVKESDE